MSQGSLSLIFCIGEVALKLNVVLLPCDWLACMMDVMLGNRKEVIAAPGESAFSIRTRFCRLERE